MAGSITFDIFARDHASGTFDKVGMAAQRSSGILSKMGGLAARGLMVAAGAATGLGVAAAAMGVKTAAANENASIAFTTMLGSGQKAAAFLKQLQAFAAKTPFEFPELQQAASSLISAGINANKVIPIMTTLGNVTSGMGTGAEGVQRATIALQQMNAAGRITAEDLNQLRDAGIPVYNLLAAATGKSKAEVVKLAQAGKLGQHELDQMMKALESGKGLERFSGLMDKQSASLSGLWSTFKDTLGQGLATAIAPAIPLLKDGLGGASAFLAGILPRVAEGIRSFIQGLRDGTGVGGFFRNVIMGIVDQARIFVINWQLGIGVAGTLRSVMSGVGSVIQSVTGFYRQHSDAINAIVVALMAGFTAFKVITAAVRIYTAVQAALNFVLTANPIGIVIVAIAALTAGIIYAYKHSQTFRNVVNGALQAVGRVGLWLWNSVFQPVIHFIVAGFASIVAGIGHMLVALGRVPGFGWAATAGRLMLGAATAAQNLANKIKKIPNKHVTITVSTHVMAGRIKVGNQYVNVGQFASGTPKAPRGWAWVGEQGPELMNLRGGEEIIPAKQSAAIASAKSVPPSVGGDQTLTVNFWLDGKVVQQSLLKLKREGGTELGLA